MHSFNSILKSVSSDLRVIVPMPFRTRTTPTDTTYCSLSPSNTRVDTQPVILAAKPVAPNPSAFPVHPVPTQAIPSSLTAATKRKRCSTEGETEKASKTRKVSEEDCGADLPMPGAWTRPAKTFSSALFASQAVPSSSSTCNFNDTSTVSNISGTGTLFSENSFTNGTLEKVDAVNHKQSTPIRRAHRSTNPPPTADDTLEEVHLSGSWFELLWKRKQAATAADAGRIHVFNPLTPTEFSPMFTLDILLVQWSDVMEKVLSSPSAQMDGLFTSKGYALVSLALELFEKHFKELVTDKRILEYPEILESVETLGKSTEFERNKLRGRADRLYELWKEPLGLLP